MTSPPTLPLSAFADESSDVFLEQLDAVQRNDITHIELRKVEDKGPESLSLAELKSIKQLANDTGIHFSAVGSPLGKCSLDEPVENQVEMCKHLIEAAQLLETSYIRMFSIHMPKGEDPADHRQQVIDILGALVSTCEGSGVILAHENEKGIYGDTAERCLDLYQTFYPTGHFKGVFDFANFIQAGDDPVTVCWPLLKGYTEYFHIKDARSSDRRVVPPGQGDGGLAVILQDAVTQGYQNHLTLEPHLKSEFGDSKTERFDLAATGLHQVLKQIKPA